MIPNFVALKKDISVFFAMIRISLNEMDT